MGRIVLALSAIGLALFFRSEASAYPAAAARMPDLVGLLVILMSLLAIGQELLRWRRRAAEGTFELVTPPSPRALKIGTLFIVLIFAYVFAVPRIGYLAATAVFLFLPMAALRPAGLPTICLTVVLVLAVIWAIFVGFLGLPIPFLPGE